MRDSLGGGIKGMVLGKEVENVGFSFFLLDK
jgi:hypothetical protein